MWPGLCKVATLTEIEAQGWSLNPGRYVGVAERAADDFEFADAAGRTQRRTAGAERRSEETWRERICRERDTKSEPNGEVA